VTYSPPVLLTPDHDVAGFTCGKPTLDNWIVGRAKANQQSGTSRTWVVVEDGGVVIGYYASSAGSLIRQNATSKARRNQPEEIPAILLGRLAVDENHQGSGLGPALLKHFIAKSLEVSEIVGVRLLLVHAIDEDARDFYLHFDFESSPIDDRTLILLLADVVAS
jgi:GNAT superfamily N-acetyltransferase